MGFRFRKSIKIGPARVNLSKSGVGYSIGTKGARISKSANGKKRATFGIPGTGVSYSKKIGGSKSTTKRRSKKSEPGTFQSTLTLAAVIAVIYFVIKYRKILMYLAIAAAVVFAAIIVYKLYQKRKNPNTEIIDCIESGETEKNNNPINDEIEQFEKELNSIPKVTIDLAPPAQRHMIRDLPDYKFSNITRSTNPASIFPIVFLDIETTGLSASKDQIIEVSAIKFDKGMTPVACFTSLCKPSNPIPPEATAVNNITDDMVIDAPSFREIASCLSDFIRDCNIAGHNLDFDLRFIFAHGAQFPTNTRFYDTLDLARLTIPKSYIWNYKLDTLCDYYRIKRKNTHRSLSDCYATSKVFSRLVFDKTSRQLEADIGDVSNLDTNAETAPELPESAEDIV